MIADVDDYERYLVRRLLEELRLADSSADLLERSIHLQACRYYRDLLGAAVPGDERSGN